MVDQLCIWFPKGKWHKKGSLSIFWKIYVSTLDTYWKNIYLYIWNKIYKGLGSIIYFFDGRFNFPIYFIYFQRSKWFWACTFLVSYIYLSRYKHLQMVCMLVFAKYISGLFDKWMMNALLDSFCVAIVLQKCHSWWCTNRDNISNLCK